MNALRQIVNQTDGEILIKIPKKYKQKRFEVILLPIDDFSENELLKAQMNLFLQSLPDTEPQISDSEIIAEIKAVRKVRNEK